MYNPAHIRKMGLEILRRATIILSRLFHLSRSFNYFVFYDVPEFFRIISATLFSTLLLFFSFLFSKDIHLEGMQI
ncbi:predicted protein [Methanosarcina acetivorans C2A]|uniref:Uncharacterized protein n=1 Tax=Methanosarcina acetivorans (strain ATCC 35395 / DSM 2834 / JCM 12185 / C2A) TaxID=188937 RepID=Q8TM99_METAC|nr:predicted protein [Methanosarcina acetivorans C2A]